MKYVVLIFLLVSLQSSSSPEFMDYPSSLSYYLQSSTFVSWVPTKLPSWWINSLWCDSFQHPRPKKWQLTLIMLISRRTRHLIMSLQQQPRTVSALQLAEPSISHRDLLQRQKIHLVTLPSLNQIPKRIR